MLKMVYGESAVKRRTVYKWTGSKREGRESMTTHGAFFNIFFFDIRGVVHYEYVFQKVNLLMQNSMLKS